MHDDELARGAQPAHDLGSPAAVPAAPPLDLHGPFNRFQPFPALTPSLSAAALFAERAAARPEATAIVDDAGPCTYAALARRARGLGALIAAESTPFDTLAILMAGDAGMWAAILACCATGRRAAVLDLHHPAARNGGILRNGRFAAVLAPASAADAVPPGVRRIGPEESGHGLLDWPPRVRSGAEIILYTSGSTGAPKGVVNAEDALLQRVAQYVDAAHLCDTDRFLTTSAPATISGLREGLAALLCGGTLHMLDMARAGLSGLMRRLGTDRITVSYTVPSILRALGSDRAAARAALASLRVLRLGGEMVLWNDVALARDILPADCHLQLAFSSTEATGTQWFVPRDLPAGSGVAPIGHVLPGTRFEALDEDGRAVPDGEPGELVITSRFVALGLWQDGQRVAGGMEPVGDGQRRLRTGDLVRRRPDGLWEACGRADRQVKINGQRVQPAEVEAFFRSLPGIADAVVLPRTGAGGTQLVVFVSPLAGAAPGVASLRQEAARALPAPMRPARLHVVGEMPRLPGGKTDAASLLALDEAPAPAAPWADLAAVPPVISRAVEQAWRAVLGPRACAGASFEAEGGDSLKFLQLVLGLETRLEIRLPLDVVHAGMRPAEIARVLTRLPSINPDPDDGTPQMLLLPGLGGDEPRLARFRAGLRGRVRLRLVELPDWPEMVRAGGGFEALAGEVARRIAAAVPHGPLLLAGYSYGGTLAIATARVLRAAGREIALVALLDTGMTLHALDADIRLERGGWRRRIRRDLASGDFSMIAALAISKAARTFGLLPLLARWPGWRGAIGHRTRGLLDRHLRLVLRFCQVDDWRRAGPPAVPGLRCVLFRSQAYHADAPQDLGWGALLTGLRVVPVPGGHHSMFDPPACDRLYDIFASVVSEELQARTRTR